MSTVFQRVKYWLARRFGAPEPVGSGADQSTGHLASQEFHQYQQLVAYDENLLERTRTQWQLGDWASLSRLERDTLQRHPDRAKLALLAAAGHLQSGSTHIAKQLILIASDWGCSRKMISQVLISGVHHSLGRASLATRQSERALIHFKSAASTVNQRVDSALWGETIALREGLRLGLLPQAAAVVRIQVPTKLNPAPVPPELGITSYAQNFEDVMLWRALGRVEKGFYIDVGAQDPIIDSVSKAFYERGWRGIHIEPVAEYAAALRHDRPDECVIEALIGAAPGSQVFFQIPNTGMSTANKDIAERHRQSGWEVTATMMPTTTLETVFSQSEGREVQWLKVDVEGMENAVFTGWGSHPARPWIVVVEATEPNCQTPTWQEWEHLLLARDYAFVYFDGLNRFYVHSSRRELAGAFQAPPNVFDRYRK